MNKENANFTEKIFNCSICDRPFRTALYLDICKRCIRNLSPPSDTTILRNKPLENIMDRSSQNIHSDDAHKENVNLDEININEVLNITGEVHNLQLNDRKESSTQTALSIIDNNLSMTVELEKKKFLDEILKFFECPVCKDTMKHRIYQCQRGHSFCYLCKTKLVNCPTCRGNLSNSRNFSLEELAVNLFSDNSKKNEFVAECVCPMKNCKFIGIPKNITQHFIAIHRGEMMVSKLYESFLLLFVQNSSSFKTQNFKKYLIDDENNIYELHLTYETNKGLEFSLNILQGNHRNNQYFYEIGLVGQENNLKSFKNNEIFKKYYSHNINEEFLENFDELSSTKKLNYYCKINIENKNFN